MAPSKVSCGEGSCKKLVTKNSKALKCDFCLLWFHCGCAQITEDEYQCFLIIKHKILWKCDKCRSTSSATTCDEVSTLGDSTSSDTLDSDNNNFFREHLKILTDQIFSLTNNHKEFIDQLNFIRQENTSLKSALTNQAEAISELLILKAGTKPTYASKLSTPPSNINKKISDKVMESISNPTNDDQAISIAGNLNTHLTHARVAASTNKDTAVCSPNPSPVAMSDEMERNLDSEFLQSSAGSNCYQNISITSESTNMLQSSCSSSLRPVSFQTVQSRKSRNIEGIRHNGKVGGKAPEKPTRARPTPKFITGKSCSSHKLIATDKKTFLFISRLSPNTTCEGITEFLNSNKEANYVVEKLTSKYPDQYASFKVGVPTSFIEDIFAPEYWPSNVFVSKYKHPKLNTKNNLNSRVSQEILQP